MTDTTPVPGMLTTTPLPADLDALRANLVQSARERVEREQAREDAALLASADRLASGLPWPPGDSTEPDYRDDGGEWSAADGYGPRLWFVLGTFAGLAAVGVALWLYGAVQ